MRQIILVKPSAQRYGNKQTKNGNNNEQTKKNNPGIEKSAHPEAGKQCVETVNAFFDGIVIQVHRLCQPYGDKNGQQTA